MAPLGATYGNFGQLLLQHLNTLGSTQKERSSRMIIKIDKNIAKTILVLFLFSGNHRLVESRWGLKKLKIRLALALDICTFDRNVSQTFCTAKTLFIPFMSLTKYS